MSSTKREKNPVEVIVFEDPAKKSKKKRDEQAASLKSDTASNCKTDFVRPLFDQKKAKYDIRKLAIKGMDKSEKEIAMADYLVELGAKKPRGKHVSIKEYNQEAKKRSLEGEEEIDQKQLDGDEQSKKPKFRKKRDKDDILGSVDGQIGTYRRGVQFINKLGKKRR